MKKVIMYLENRTVITRPVSLPSGNLTFAVTKKWKHVVGISSFSTPQSFFGDNDNSSDLQIGRPICKPVSENQYGFKKVENAFKNDLETLRVNSCI